MANREVVQYLGKYYRPKIISIISGENQSFVSKHYKEAYVASTSPLTSKQQNLCETINMITECREISGRGTSEQDQQYISLLHYLLVDKDSIKKVYYDLSYKTIAKIIQLDIEFYSFDFKRLKIDKKSGDELVEAIKSFEKKRKK